MTNEEVKQLNTILFNAGIISVLEHIGEEVKRIDSDASSLIEKSLTSLDSTMKRLKGYR